MKLSGYASVMMALGLVQAAALASASQPHSACFQLSHLMEVAATQFPSVKAQEANASAINQNKWADLLNNTQLQAGWEQTQANQNMSFGGQAMNTQWSERSRSYGIQVSASIAMIFKYRGMNIAEKIADSVTHAISLETAANAATSYIHYLAAVGELQARSRMLSVFRRLRAQRTPQQMTSLLIGEIHAIESHDEILQLTRDNARAEISEYLGRDVSDQNLTPCGSAASNARDALVAGAREEKVNWSFLNRLFRLPAPNAKQAMVLAEANHNPKLFQAKLESQEAINKWNLDMSSEFFPTLVLNVTHATTTDSYGINGGDVSGYGAGGAIGNMGMGGLTDGITTTLSLNWSIGAGSLNLLSADDFLHQKARYDEQTARRELFTHLVELYNAVKIEKINIQKCTRSSMEALASASQAHSVSDAVTAYEVASPVVKQLFQQIAALLVTKIQIQAAVGTLNRQVRSMAAGGI